MRPSSAAKQQALTPSISSTETVGTTWAWRAAAAHRRVTAIICCGQKVVSNPRRWCFLEDRDVACQDRRVRGHVDPTRPAGPPLIASWLRLGSTLKLVWPLAAEARQAEQTGLTGFLVFHLVYLVLLCMK